MYIYKVVTITNDVVDARAKYYLSKTINTTEVYNKIKLNEGQHIFSMECLGIVEE